MATRRHFLKKAAAFSAAGLAFPYLQADTIDQIEIAAKARSDVDPKTVARDEEFWRPIQAAFDPSPHFINLENGYFSPQPKTTLEALTDNQQMVNRITSLYMRRHMTEEHTALKRLLADFAGCSPEELVITRNTTESLDTIIHGLDLKKGDEVITTHQDYGSMLEAFDQQSRRTGIVPKRISLPLHPKNDEEVVGLFEEAITPKTKLILVTHLINLSGQVLPAKKICDMAHARGVEVMVDAAHSFAHLDFKISDLGCDYLGASLHKWLSAPLGTGIMYIKQEKIEKIWPLFGDKGKAKDDIRKFEHIGTSPPANYLTIANAIRFHEAIGSKRKEERLRYLKNYWAERAAKIDGVTINTPWPDHQCGALGNISIEGLTPNETSRRFYDDYRIFTVAINSHEVNGVRVTPHLYTRIAELDKFVEAIGEIAG